MRLRSLLFVPGDRPERMEKALASGADAVILDLEDSVSLEHKAVARVHVAEFLARAAGAERGVPLLVRVNPAATGLLDADLAAIIPARPDALVVPKAEGAATIADVHRRLAGAACPLLLIATETPAAVFRLGDYAAHARDLIGLTWGVEDLSAAVGAVSARTPDGAYTPPFETLRGLLLFAAHAAGVAPIDTIYPAFRDLQGLAAYAARAARDGFSGMLAIHPAQVVVINAAFTPTAAAVAAARRVVAAFAAQPGVGAVGLDGAMLDAPHLRQALRIIAQADDAG